MADVLPRPVFLVGPVRSGTTMLRLMIDHHPDISFPNESEFLTQLLAGGTVMPDAAAFRGFLAQNRQFRNSGLELNTAPADYVAQCEDIMAQYRARKGSGIVGTTVHNHFDALPQLFPGARFIHLLRDGRDMARSAIPMGWAGTVYEGADIWMNTERTWDRLVAQVPAEACTEVRYETLLEQPEVELARLCGFFGVDYDPVMLTYPDNSTYSAPDPAFAYQWKAKQTPRELGLVEGKIGDMLVARGYALSGHPIIEPGTLARLSMAVAGKRHRLMFRVRRFGMGLTLADWLSRTLGMQGWRKKVARKMDDITQQHVK